MTAPQAPRPSGENRLPRDRVEELLAKMAGRRIVIVGDAGGACFGKQPVRKRLAQRMHATTCAHARLEDGDVVSELREFVTRYHAGEAGAQNYDPLRRVTQREQTAG